MRTATMAEICKRAQIYAIETLDIERCLVIKKDRAECRNEAETNEGIETDIENKAMECALRLAADAIRGWPDFPSSVESRLFEWLEKQKYCGSPYQNRLELELDADRRLEKYQEG